MSLRYDDGLRHTLSPHRSGCRRTATGHPLSLSLGSRRWPLPDRRLILIATKTMLFIGPDDKRDLLGFAPFAVFPVMTHYRPRLRTGIA